MRALAYPIFRWLLLTSLISEIGSWMQFVGSEWFLTSSTLDPLQVSLLAAATTLPLFLLGIPAGVLADMFGRRRILLFAQFWMVTFAILPLVMLRAGILRPPMMIAVTFALYCGLTLQTPAIHAAYAEAVPHQHIASAVTLLGVEFNVGRVAGPVLAGAVISHLGIASAFIANVLSFAGFICFLILWKPANERPPRSENMVSATANAFRHLRSSRDVMIVMTLGAVYGFLAWGPTALLSIIARSRLHLTSGGYGLLLSGIGGGAVAGSLLVAPLLASFRGNRVLGAGMLLGSLSMLGVSRANNPVLMGVLLFLLGAGASGAYIAGMALVQSGLPNVVRARVMGILIMTFSAGTTAGSASFGWLSRSVGVETAQVMSGGCMALIALCAVASGVRIASAADDSNSGESGVADVGFREAMS